MFSFKEALKTRAAVTYRESDYFFLRVCDSAGFAACMFYWFAFFQTFSFLLESETVMLVGFLGLTFWVFMFLVGSSKLAGRKTLFYRSSTPGRFVLSASMKDAIALMLWPLVIRQIERKAAQTVASSDNS